MTSTPPIVRITNLKQHIGSDVTIRGWLYNQRGSGKIRFLQIRDGSGFVQGIAEKGTLGEEAFAVTKKIPQESSIIVVGHVRADERAPSGVELSVNRVDVLQEAEAYPIRKFSAEEEGPGVEFLMNHRHLWLRSKRQAAVMRVRHTIIQAVRNFLDDEGFIVADAPIFTPNACEGTTDLFETKYFDDVCYLSQSGQLYNEATAMALGKVYCFGPTFRSEKSKTRRHLTEFWMVEPEMAYASLDDVMDLSERFLYAIVQKVLERNRGDLADLERDVAKLEAVKLPFPRLSYDDAAELLHKNGASFTTGDDFGAPDEEFLSKQYDSPVMVHRYPAAVKAFYMKHDPAQPDKALCVDVLAPEGYGEIIGGGEREDSHDVLVAAIKKHNLPLEAFDWYLDLRKFGSVPHAGFGMGIERAVAWICGLHHVRETIPFPRMLYRNRP